MEQQQQHAVPGASQQQPLPLLQLPALALEVIARHLAVLHRAAYRGTCRALRQAANAATARVVVKDADFFAVRGWPARFPHACVLQLVEKEPPSLNLMALAKPKQWHARWPVEPWPSITRLILCDMHLEAAHHVMACCPNATSLNTSSFLMRSGEERLASFAQWLPQLRSLTVPQDCHLSESAMRALSGFPHLEAVDVALFQCGTSGWDALLGMTQLTSLRFTALDSNAFGVEGVNRGSIEQLDFGRLTQLQVLSLTGLHDDIVIPTDVQNLPSTLQELTLRQLPGSPFDLPQLRELCIMWEDVGSEQLSRLAVSCPQLVSLTVGALIGGPTCPTPLSAVTSVRVMGNLTMSHAASALFPALRSLTCHGHLVTEQFFVGAATIEHLNTAYVSINDVCEGDYYYDADPYNRPVAMDNLHKMHFNVLSALPALKQLRCNAHSRSVECLSQLRQLTSVTFVVASDKDSCAHLNRLSTALGTSAAPAHLSAAAFEFLHAADEDEDSDFDDGPAYDVLELDEAKYHSALRDVADSAASWMVLAPALTHVRWDSRHFMRHVRFIREVHMSDLRLAALASNPGLKEIYIGRNSDVLTPGAFASIQWRHMPHGLDIIVEPEHTTAVRP